MSETHTSPILDGLSKLEHEVIEAAHRGVWVKPDTAVEVGELAVTNDHSLQVRADLLRELLMGRRGELDPRGLRIQGVRVIGPLDLDYITTAVGLTLFNCALPEGVRCSHSRLGRLNLSGSLTADLFADGLRIDGNLTLTDVNVRGMMRLHSAHIGGQLNLDRTTVINDRGPALDADALCVEGVLFMRDAIMTGTSKVGAVLLNSAQLGVQLALHRTNVTNDSGPALVADRLRTEGHLFLEDAAMNGKGKDGTVRLHSAHIGGQVVLRGLRVDNDSGPLLLLSETRVHGVIYMSASIVCPQASPEVETRGGGCPNGSRQMQVREFVFLRLRDVSWLQWLHLLVHHTPEYSPQPYQQLAVLERDAGHDTNARHVLITQQKDLRRRTPESLGGRIARRRHWLWGWLGCYGYRAHRLVAALTIVLAMAGGLGYVAGQISTRPGHQTAERVTPATASPNTSGTPCSTAELIGLGLDRGLPLGATGLRARCDLDTATRWGQAFTYAMWVLQGLVWALATLTIAAYTGLVRKPT